MLYLKEKRYAILQMACGDIIDVDIKNNTFIINTKQQMMFEILTNPTNEQILRQALNWQGFNGKIVVNKLDSGQDIVDKDTRRLRELGIDFKIIKGEKNG